MLITLVSIVIFNRYSREDNGSIENDLQPKSTLEQQDKNIIYVCPQVPTDLDDNCIASADSEGNKYIGPDGIYRGLRDASNSNKTLLVNKGIYRSSEALIPILCDRQELKAKTFLISNCYLSNKNVLLQFEKGVVLEGDEYGAEAGILWEGSESNLNLKGITIQGFDFAGVVVFDNAKLFIDDSIITQNGLLGVYAAILIRDSYGEISNSFVYDNGYIGITFNSSKGKVKNNTIYGNGITTPVRLGYSTAGIFVAEGSIVEEISQNVIAYHLQSTTHEGNLGVTCESIITNPGVVTKMENNILFNNMSGVVENCGNHTNNVYIEESYPGNILSVEDFGFVRFNQAESEMVSEDICKTLKRLNKVEAVSWGANPKITDEFCSDEL